MRHKLKLLIIALLGVVLAYANTPPRFVSSHRYAWLHSSMDGSKYYISKDLTAYGWTKGVDYDCVPPYLICTFWADPTKIHVDGTGTWFYVTDVPSSGIDNTGVFEPLDY